MSISADLIVSMLALCRERRTGVVTIQSDAVRTFVYLRDGVVVFAEEGTHGESLGRLLVRQQILTPARYVEIIGKMTDAFVLNEQLRFGEVAVELGYLTEPQVEKALRDQIRWKIVRAFQRPGATWVFEDSEARVLDAGHFPTPLESLVFEVARWVDDDEKRELGLARLMDKPLGVVPEAVARLEASFGFSASELAFAALVDGTRTVRQLLVMDNPEAVDTHALLTAMIICRVATAIVEAPVPVVAKPPTPAPPVVPPPIAAAPQPAPVAAKPAPQPAPVAAKPAPQPAPVAAKPAPQPAPVAAQPAKPGVRLPVTRTSRILEALSAQRVKVEPMRTPRSDHEAKLLAERAFQKGLEHMKAGRFQAASDDLREAVQLSPSSFEYRLYEKWCALRCRGEPPHGVDLAELRRLSTSALSSDPNFAFAYCVAGEIALGEGLDKQAFRMLKRAEKLDPELLEVQRLLRVLARRRATVKE